MSDLLRHKGYFGSVEYSEQDQVFHGKLLYIRSLVTYEGTNVKGLRSAFEEAVDDYLEACKSEKLEPEQPFKGSFNVRIGRTLHQRIALAAAKQGISLNKYISEILERETQAQV